MSLEGELRRLNRNMIAFDLALGTGALLFPTQTLQLLGHAEPTDDAEHLFRRCGPIWLTFAAAHLIADRSGSSRDWWAVSWLRATELLTDVVWSRSESFSARGRAGMLFAGASNLVMTLGFAHLARSGGTRR